MAYLIDRKGNKHEVSDEILDGYGFEQTALVSEDVILQDRYLVTVYNNPNKLDSRPDCLDYENYVEKIFDSKPTEEQLIHFMITNGFMRRDFVTVMPIKQLDFKY